jgi:hypothetical protein
MQDFFADSRLILAYKFCVRAPKSVIFLPTKDQKAMNKLKQQWCKELGWLLEECEEDFDELKHHIEHMNRTGEIIDVHFLQEILPASMQNIEDEMIRNIEYFELGFDLRQQYNECFEVLSDAKVLTEKKTVLKYPDGSEFIKTEYGIQTADKTFYPIPSFKEVAMRLIEQDELVRKKAAQGFTRLMLVPFAQDNMTLQLSVHKALERRFDEHRLYRTFERTLDSGTWDIRNADGTVRDPIRTLHTPPITQFHEEGGFLLDPETALYYPEFYGTGGHGGKTKKEILERDPRDAWSVVLVENNPNIPNAESPPETATKGDRRRLRSGYSADQYRQFLSQEQSNPSSPYYGETGTTLEDWFTQMLMSVHMNRQVIDDSDGHGSGAMQLGMYIPDGGEDGMISCRWVHNTTIGDHALIERIPSTETDTLVGARTVVHL